MSFKSINLDGGEMPLGQSMVAILEFPTLVKHIHKILNALPKSEDKWPVYCFEFGGLTPTKSIEAIIIQLEKLYPEARFYECDGRKVFDIRGESGGIVSKHVCYLMAK